MENKKILVVDDEFTIRYLVEHQLKRHGFEAVMAKDGPSALEAARTHKPDLIVLDIMMPGMDGFDVCRQLKNDPDLAHIPVIFLTALARKKDKLRAFEAGADDYLTKPFQTDEFVAHLTAVLRRAGQRKNSEGQAKKRNGRIAALYSPKGGVGTSTLAIHMGEALVLREGHKVVLIDLALPLGGLAPMLKLYSARHIMNLLTDQTDLNLDEILRNSQRHRANLHIIPAPGFFIQAQEKPSPARLNSVLNILTTNGYDVVLDAGSTLTPLTFAALKHAHKNFVVTSGQPIANQHIDTFLAAARQIGLDPRRLMPVVNEIHGPVDDVKLARLPVARIPHVSERSRTRLWLQEQGFRKLVSIMLT